MDAPTHYSDVCIKALEAKEKYNLSDVQTLLYNHICRGDFLLRNEDGQKFYDVNNNGFGWRGSRDWVKKQFKPLLKAGVVNFSSQRDCRGGKYTSWYFYSPEYEFEELIDASCYVRTWKLAMIKHYLKLDDGFDKKNQIYGDIEFIHNEHGYTFKYKGEESIYAWGINGEKDDISWLKQCDSNGNFTIQQPTWIEPRYYGNFGAMLHDIWCFLAHDGYAQMSDIPNYTHKRRFTI